MIHSLLLPSLGEGIETGTIVSVSVQPGSLVAVGQPLFDVEADKVTVEIPATLEGELVELLVMPGDEVPVGARLATIRTAAAEVSGPAPVELPGSEHEGRSSRPDIAPSAGRVDPIMQTDTGVPPSLDRSGAPAGPAARRMARVLGIDIRSVPGSGHRGRISRQDVIAQGARLLQQGGVVGGKPTPDITPLPDQSCFGLVEEAALDSIQRATARNMARSWREIPHAWLERRLDITRLERHRRKRDRSAPGGFTLTPYLVKALAGALQEFPLFNASIDMAVGRLLQRRYFDIGVAVDTPRGLMVPVVRGVEGKALEEIAGDLRRLSEDARANRLPVEALQGAGITLSNLGGMGIDRILPLINWPQSAILGVASCHRGELGEGRGTIRNSRLLPVTLAVDHRLINGAEGVRFLQYLEGLLQHPGELG